MVAPAFAFYILPELFLRLPGAHRVLTDADLEEWIPLESVARLSLLLVVQGSSKRLEIDLSCVTAVAPHIELHGRIIEEVLAIRTECIVCGSRSEFVDPSVSWNNFSLCLSLIV